MNKKLYNILLEFSKAKTWEGVNKHNAKRFIESYVDRIENVTPDAKEVEEFKEVYTEVPFTKSNINTIRTPPKQKLDAKEESDPTLKELWAKFNDSEKEECIRIATETLEARKPKQKPDGKKERWECTGDRHYFDEDARYCRCRMQKLPKQKPSEWIEENYDKRAKGFTYTQWGQLDEKINLVVEYLDLMAGGK